MYSCKIDSLPLEIIYRAMKRHGMFAMSLLFLASCSQPKNNATVFFPVDSLVKSQVAYLANVHATLKKTATLGDSRDEKSYAPADAASWEKELEIFSALNAINKPINAKAYIIDHDLTDLRSNLKVDAWTAKPGEKEDLPIRSLRVYYQQPRELRRVEAEFDESNAVRRPDLYRRSGLYQSHRLLTMEFQKVNNKTVLISYSIEGGQKMYLGDTVRYNIAAAITLPK
jgi:hypothetical protein